MFVQVIKGKTSDAEGLRRQTERWRDEVRPGAIGFLGGTGGVAEDGTFVLVARFEDEAAAGANAERPEQGAWYEETAKYFDDEPTFRESSDTATLFDGGSDAAGFVQVMEGRILDRAKADALEAPEMTERLRTVRPDLIGGLRVAFPDDTFVQVAYFTSEAAAREGEASPESSGERDQFEAAFADIGFLDLKQPFFT